MSSCYFVQQFVCPPLPSPQRGRFPKPQRGVQANSAANASSSTRDGAAQPSVEPMLAVLTTRRVLVLAAARLKPVAEAWGHPRNSRSALGASGGLSVSAVSVAWAGSSVVCTLEDGR